MSSFFFVLLAGVAWMGLRGDVSWQGFAIGAALGAVIYRVERVAAHRPFSAGRAMRLVGLGVRFLALFLRELVVANLEQLRIVLARRVDVQPGWVVMRTQLETPAMRAFFGMVLSLTPGSLTFEERQLEDGGWAIGIHVLDLRDQEALLRVIRERIEAPLRDMETL